MAPREKLALLQRESKPSKHGNKLVYACPKCWGYIGIGKPLSEVICHKCWIHIMPGEAEIFDSRAEHTRGYGELKPLEISGVITDLKHHKVFKLVPAEYIKIGKNGWIRSELGVSETIVKSLKLSGYFKMRPELKYKADFTYKEKEEIIVEEIKRLGTKEITKTVIDAITKKTYNQTFKISYPYFADPESEFKKICQLMLVIHGHWVQIRTDETLWMFTDEWELERVHGRIK